MGRLVLALALGFCISSPASAGRNTNGALLVHTDDSADYYSASRTFCSSTMPAACADLDPNGTRDESQIVWLLAVFPAGSYPGVRWIRFGIHHTFAGKILDYSSCGAGAIDEPEENWPNGLSGVAGDRVTLAAPVYESLFVFYWFALDLSGSDPSLRFFDTTFDPESGTAEFGDDSTPAAVDRCYDFGTMRWDGRGVNECPIPLPTGVCCLSDHSCIITTQLDCDHLGATYLGSAACDPNPCLPPTGACCLVDGTCQELSQEDCARFSCTAYQGDGTTCADVSCTRPIGACCLTGGSCVMESSPDCLNSGGLFYCDAVCDPNPCAHWGACCFADLSCSFLTAPLCQAEGGTYEGDGSDCESPTPCITGACCLANLECLIRTPHGCAALLGLYLGDGVSCDPPPCDRGACCLWNLTCEVTDIYWCASQMGTWYGSGTACPPDPPCGEEGTFAACCLGSACVMTTEADCGRFQGQWLDGSRDCVICVGPATKKATWGSIKALFR